MKTVRRIWNNFSRQIAALAVAVPVAWGLVPRSFAEEIQTFTFSHVKYGPAEVNPNYREEINLIPSRAKEFWYSANGPKMTMTAHGYEIDFIFPPHDDFPAIAFHGKWGGSIWMNGDSLWWFTGELDGEYGLCGFQSRGPGYLNTFSAAGGPAAGKSEESYGGSIRLTRREGNGDRYFKIHFDNEKPESRGPEVVTTDAKPDAGEDKGEGFGGGGGNGGGGDNPDEPGPMGPIGGGVAVGVGIGSLVSKIIKKKTKNPDKEKDEEKEEKKEASYRMYVHKDFGDAIRAGAGPVRVCARIAKVEDGVERDDAGMTAAIVPSTTGLTLHSSGMHGRYMAANVSAPEGASGEGIVTFTIRTPAGGFVRNIVFRIVGETRIAFPALVEDGKSWDFSQSLDSVDVVGGMGGKARLRFVFVDAVQEPASISFSSVEGFQIAAVKDTSVQFTYYAEITNRTRKLEKEGGIYLNTAVKTVTIKAEMPDGSRVTGQFYINVYPDGITIDANRHTYFKKGMLEVDTFAIKLKEINGTQKSSPVPFAVYACYVKDGEQVVRFNPPVTFGKLEDRGRYGDMFTKTYRCRVTTSAPYQLFSLDSLCQIGDPYEVTMGVSYKEDGQNLSADIPLRLIGETPTPPPAPGKTIDRKKELERLKKDIAVFGLADPDLKQLVRNAPMMSGDDLRYVRWHVVAAGKAFYENMSAEYASYDKVLTKYIVVSGSLVSLGDKAVEGILTEFLGNENLASIVAAVFNPFKNALAEHIGQYVCRLSFIDIAEKDAETTPFIQSLIQGVQDGIEAHMFSDRKWPDRNELAKVVSAYLLYCFAKHYWYGEDGEQGDIAKSVIAALKDLALAKIKDGLTKLAKAGMEKCAKAIGEKVGQQLCATFEKQAKERALQVGRQAFEQTLRQQAKAAGRVTFEGAKKALDDKKLFQTMEEEMSRNVGKMLQETAPKYAAGVIKGAGEKLDLMGAHLLNYLFGGTLDKNELLGTSTGEVLIKGVGERVKAYLKLQCNLDVDKVTENLTNPLDLSAKVDGAILTLGIYRYNIVIDIQKNLEALFGILFELYFGWMEDLWKYLEIQRDYNVGIDDPEYDKDMFQRMADRAREAKEGFTIEKRKGK